MLITVFEIKVCLIIFQAIRNCYSVTWGLFDFNFLLEN